MSASPDLLTSSIDTLASGHDLTREQTASVLSEIMRGNASEIQIAAFLIALRTKGETVQELAGLAQAMRSLATPVRVQRDNLLDTAGTGGGRRTFNVSTTAALIAAGAGCTVAKHGNRSATGLSGSADVLEALGARIDLNPAAVAACIELVGFGFMFAPAHHQATRYVVGVRRQLAVRTIFNFLGPLTNPAGARRQLIGVSDPAYLETMAGALAVLGTDHALLVSSQDGLDELSISAPTQVVEVRGDALRAYLVTPEEVGLSAAPPDRVPGGDPAQNADTARRILGGEPGPPRDLAVLNAGAAIYAAAGSESLAEGVRGPRRRSSPGRRPARWSVSWPPPPSSRTGRHGERPDPDYRAHAGPGGAPAGSDPTGRRPGPGRGSDRRGSPPLVRHRIAGRRPERDRRAQAAVSVGRDDPRGGVARGGGRRLSARWRGGPVDPDRGAQLRRLAV